MLHVLRRDDLGPSSDGSVRFEGEPYGAGISFIVTENEPGQGPALHRHPYPETWIVRAGRAAFTADGDDVEVGPGDAVVAGPGTPHCFRNIGPGRLDLVCIHASAHISTEWLNVT
jgi:mannose-6-phosphate isomerase-like protein (cupin superfamily)